MKQYYMDIMSPFAQPFVINGVKAVRELDPSMVLTGHGAVLDTMIGEICDVYERLAEKPKKEGKTAAVIYVSAYGYTRSLAEAISGVLTDTGIKVSLIELNDGNREQAMAAVGEADGILFGSPTFLGDVLQPIGELLAAIHPYQLKGKLCSAFGSYGWSGEAVGNINSRLEQLKSRTIEGFRVRFRPSAAELENVRAFARTFAENL